MLARYHIKLCRPKHWVKNALVFAPPFFGGTLFSADVLKHALPAFLGFSFFASAVYVFNDIFDRERDAQHPTKCMRPIASGQVSLSAAWGLFVFLLIGGGVMTCFASSLFSFLILCAYLFINVMYSRSWKHHPILELFVLASGFVFRIYYSQFFFSVPISSWLFLCVFCGALFFAIGKRRNELLLQKAGAKTRAVLRSYNLGFLTRHYYLFAGLFLIFYSMWSISAAQVRGFEFTVPFVAFIIMRYNLILELKGSDGDPVSVLMKDKVLLISAFLFCLLSCALLYGNAVLTEFLQMIRP